MKWLPYILVSILAFCLGWLIHDNADNSDHYSDTITNTNTVRKVDVDTIYILSPQPYLAWIDKRDTIYASDSCFHYREYKEYSDSNYYAKVSGVDPILDEIRVYPKTIREYVYQDRYIYTKPKKFGLGISAGYGIGKNGLSPVIAISVNYNLFNF